MFLVLCRASVAAPELLVDATAGPEGDGSQNAPFQTISAALASAPATGAVLTVREGVYPETLQITKGGTPESPLIIRAAKGASVTVSGFTLLIGWQDEGDGLFSLKTTQPVRDLFVDANRQPLARFPKADSPWLRVITSDPATATITLESLPPLSEEDVNNLQAVVYCQSITGEEVHRVTKVDAEAQTLLLQTSPERIRARKGDALLLYNADSFATGPGEWSCRRVEGGFRVLFRPVTPDDLTRTQTRARGTAIRIAGPEISHVEIDGLEVVGASQYGIQVTAATELVIRNCVIYANGRDSGAGVRLDNCRDVTLDSCVIFANAPLGLSLVQGENITLQGCEVAFNDMDGIQMSGRPDAPEQPLKNVTLRNCYFHHHLHTGHPDNTQIFGHVRDVAYENNLLLLGGQNAMIQECEGLRFTNNAFVGAVARHVILGHKTTRQADFTNNTFAFARYGAIGTAASGVSLEANVFYQNTLSYEADDIRGNHNLFWMARETDPILIATKPNWKNYLQPEQFAADHQMEATSVRENPEFKNVPTLQVIGLLGFLHGSVNTIPLNAKDAGEFALGDTIEINGDGVARRVESKDATSLTFTPALAAIPFKAPVIWKWAQDANLKLDFESPRTGKNGQPGAALNVPAYQRGELDGSGHRSLPKLSVTAESAIPNPTVFVYPFCLPP